MPVWQCFIDLTRAHPQELGETALSGNVRCSNSPARAKPRAALEDMGQWRESVRASRHTTDANTLAISIVGAGFNTR